MDEAKREMTYGEKAVGLTFNPSNNTQVQALKIEFAHLIDDVNSMKLKSDDPEVKRLASVAITELQTAQMWAVKAATWNK